MLPGLQEFYEGGLVAAIFVFIALPYLYLSLASQVQSEYTEVLKSILGKTSGTWKSQKKLELKELLESHLHVFQVDWWFVMAFGIIMLFLFNLDSLMELSNYFKDACSAVSSTKNCQVKFLADGTMAFNCDKLANSCREMKRALATYTLAVGLVFAFRLWLERVTAAKELRKIYAEMDD